MDRLTALLLDAQAGDAHALERFIVETRHDVIAMCRYLGDPDNVEDLAQESYERAIASLHRFRAEGPARHWLLTITRRVCADATRTRRRRRRLSTRVAAEPHDTPETASPVGASTELDELLQRLDPDRRAAFVLTQITGLRYGDASQLLGVPVGTIRSRVARAREDLLNAVRDAESAATVEPIDRIERPEAQ